MGWRSHYCFCAVFARVTGSFFCETSEIASRLFSVFSFRFFSFFSRRQQKARRQTGPLPHVRVVVVRLSLHPFYPPSLSLPPLSRFAIVSLSLAFVVVVVARCAQTWTSTRAFVVVVVLLLLLLLSFSCCHFCCLRRCRFGRRDRVGKKRKK